MVTLESVLTAVLLAPIAFFYTMAGFAGGSMFTALLLLTGLSAGAAALGG